MTREPFLTRLRERLAVPAPANLPHALVPVEGVPRVRFPDERDFVTMSNLNNAPVSSDIEALVAQVLDATGARTALCSRDPEPDAVRPLLEAAGVEILPFDSFATAARADLGVAGARWAIAATGTLVLYADRAGGRSASLVPPALLAIVREENILHDAAELFRERMPDPMPSQIVLATGPSRSADIELTLTVGVHGPGRVWVGIL
jgi:L-lactate dehydrogenase complex protein LldG